MYIKSFKTEIDPDEEQKNKIIRTIGVTRWMYNLYIDINDKRYKDGKKFMSNNEFLKWFNNVYYPNHENEIYWVKETLSLSRQRAVKNACTAYKRFFKKQAKHPRFKSRRHNNSAMYFCKNIPKSKQVSVDRDKIKIPSLGYVKLKEKDYLPLDEYNLKFVSGNVSVEAGRFYVSVSFEFPDPTPSNKPKSEGLGIDLGVKDLAIVSNGKKYKNINKSWRIRKLERKLKREQRKLFRKQRIKVDGKTVVSKNYEQQVMKIQRLHQRLTNIRNDYQNKVISEIVSLNPEYITIEDLNVSGMMKNRHLSKAIKDSKMYEFKRKLEWKCFLNSIDLRVVDRWYPSSKTCNNCGCVKKDLKLKDRIFTCPDCGYTQDRDLNASFNLRDSVEYRIVT